MSPAESGPRHCAVCGVPLSGVWAAFLRLAGVSRSPRNPRLCTRCNAHFEQGGLVELTVVFADLSSFTAMTAEVGASRSYEVVDAFLRQASETLSSRGAFIDKYIGDAVMAFFNAPIRRADHRARALEAAAELQARLPELSRRLGRELRASVGIASGYARVGRLGADEGRDFTAIGDVVNLAARLQAQARGGEIVASEDVYAAAAAAGPEPPRELLTLKGFAEPVAARRLGAGAGPLPSPDAGADYGNAADWSALILAVIGSGCVTSVAAGTLSAVYGGAALAAAAALARGLDRSILRLPLLAVAAGAGLYGLRQSWRAFRSKASTLHERRRAQAGLAAAGVALALVLGELGAHVLLHGFGR